jgi:hypothetical protein
MPQFADQYWAAYMLPAAQYTRSTHINMPRTDLESGRYRIDWNWSVIVLALKFTIRNASAVGQGLLAPSLNDLVVNIEYSNEKLFTSTSRDSDALPVGDTFCDVAAVDMLTAPRQLMIAMKGPCELGFRLRWLQFTAGTPRTEDAMVGINAIVRHCSDQEAQDAINKMREYSR